MEDNTKRLDKTLGDLTAKDVIVIGTCILAAKACKDVFHASMAPTYRKWSKQLRQKTEELKTKEDLKHGQYL